MFCDDFIGPLTKRVMRKLGIKEDTSKVVIVPEKQYTFQDGVADFPAESMAFSEGETIVLTIDGITYTGKAKPLIADGIPPAVYIGNPSLPGMGDDSGEPYILMAQDATSVSAGYLLLLAITDNAATHTVHAYKQTTVTTPISDKYLPGVCLPVVELSTVVQEGGTPAQLTEAEAAVFNKLASTKMPCIVRFNSVSPDNVVAYNAATAAYASNEMFSDAYVIPISGSSYMFVHANDTWMAFNG